MKKYTLLFCLALFVQAAFSQKLYFARSNYTDSVAMAQNIPALAKQVIEKYKEEDKDIYYSTMGCLYIAAKQYAYVNEACDNRGRLYIEDTTQIKIVGFALRVYSQSVESNQNFDTTYTNIFYSLYNKLNDESSGSVEYSYNRGDNGASQKIKANVDTLINTDSISLNAAVSLCKNYGLTLVYAEKPVSIAKKILAQIEANKFIINDSVLIKMPDGATVALTIIRKKEITTPQPVVLRYNIYAGSDKADCKYTVSQGYVGIVANTRGKRLSMDALEPFEHDAKDAYFIIDWISKQPWCNGKIGMYGGSYLGFAQWATVKNLHPALKTIVPQVSVGAGIDYPMENGIYMSFMLRWAHFVMDTKLLDAEGFNNTKNWNTVFENWYTQGKSYRSLDTIEGRPNYIFQRWLQHPSYDSYWQSMTPQKQEFAKINIPILTITGYWDDDQLGAMYYYRQHHLWNKNANHYLIIGPFDHGGSQGYPQKQMSGYTIDSVANIPIQDIVFQWMDYVLKDSIHPTFLQDKVNFEVMGKNEWKHVPSLDKMNNDTLVFYLGNTAKGTKYPLLKSKPTTKAFITQMVDLKERTERPVKAGNNIDRFPILLDTILNPEKEKLFFISEPIETPFAISGNIKASILASINKKDIDLVLDLYEQTPDGKYLALNENLLRASYAKDRTKRELLQPNKIETINITNTFITSRQLQKGSRIIVLLGLNQSPSWQINYGTGKDVSDETIKDAAIPFEIKWYNSSCIKFPILK